MSHQLSQADQPVQLRQLMTYSCLLLRCLGLGERFIDPTIAVCLKLLRQFLAASLQNSPTREHGT